MIDLLLNCACFIYIGAWLPFASFNVPELGILPYRLALLFLSVMVLRRIPALLILYRFVPEITNWKEALFSGHFGEFLILCPALRFDFDFEIFPRACQQPIVLSFSTYY